MPITLGKNLHFCFTKSKRPMLSQSSNINDNQEHHNITCHFSIPFTNLHSNVTSSSLLVEVDLEFELTSSTFKAEHQGSETLLDGCTAIPTYSPNPYLDFRRSMQEIVESFNLSYTRANWAHYMSFSCVILP